MKRNWVLRDTSKKSERLFFNIFDQLPYDIFIVDREWNIQFFNEKGEKTLRNFSNEWAPRSMLDMVSERDFERFKNTIISISDGKNGKICLCNGEKRKPK